MNKKGITLIELMIALCISAIIMAGVYRVFIAQAKNYSYQEEVADAQNAVRVGMEILVSDLRMAGYNPEDGVALSAIPISGTKTTIRLEWQEGAAVKIVQYRLSNGTLIRNVNGEDQEVLDDVKTLDFTFTTSGTKIVQADIVLTVKNRTLTSSIIFRNVK
jgi:prepilin-type N-terminal cleavage/methylation domain-containing protein